MDDSEAARMPFQEVTESEGREGQYADARFPLE